MSSLDSAISLLALFDTDRLRISVSDAATLTGLPKSSVSRLFKTLEAHHFVIQNGSRGAYSIGTAINRLGKLYRGGSHLIEKMESFLYSLVADTGATGYLTQVTDEGLEILDVVQGSYPIRLVHEIGTIERIDSTSAGLATVMRLPAEEQDAFAANATLGAARIREILEDAVDTCTVRLSSHVYPGFRAIGVAIRDEERDTTFGVSLSYPDVLLSDDVETQVRNRISAAALDFAKISGDHFLISRLSDRVLTLQTPKMQTAV